MRKLTQRKYKAKGGDPGYENIENHRYQHILGRIMDLGIKNNITKITITSIDQDYPPNILFELQNLKNLYPFDISKIVEDFIKLFPNYHNRQINCYIEYDPKNRVPLLSNDNEKENQNQFLNNLSNEQKRKNYLTKFAEKFPGIPLPVYNENTRTWN